MLDGKFPSQEYLGAILVSGEAGRIKAAAATLNDSVRLAGIEYHNRTPGQGNTTAYRGKMQVQTSVIAQEKMQKAAPPYSAP